MSAPSTKPLSHGADRWDLRETVPDRGAARFPLGPDGSDYGESKWDAEETAFPSGRPTGISGKLAGVRSVGVRLLPAHAHGF